MSEKTIVLLGDDTGKKRTFSSAKSLLPLLLWAGAVGDLRLPEADGSKVEPLRKTREEERRRRQTARKAKK